MDTTVGPELDDASEAVQNTSISDGLETFPVTAAAGVPAGIPAVHKFGYNLL